jgi:serine/threonine protein kinase
MVDFDKVSIGKKLGAGMFGTTYLAEYKGNKYALKIQHILEKSITKDFKSEIWREMDLYSYINKLSKDEQVFFTKLHGYHIYDNCDHKQERPFKVQGKEFKEEVKQLDKSKYCVKYLLDYGGKTTLHTFLAKNKLTHKLVCSILLQICKIIYTLYLGGYSHGDLHPGNIMINSTDKKTFELLGNKISYEGYQLSAIDYGEVLHKKYKIKYDGPRKLFLSNIQSFIFDDMFYGTIEIISRNSKRIIDCKEDNKLLPWERAGGNTYELATRQFILNHPEFYHISKHKYLKIYNGADILFEKIEKYTNKKIHDIVKDNLHEYEFWSILNRILYEFQLFYPEKFTKYWKWCSSYEFLLPKMVVLDLLLMTNYKEYIEYLIKYMKNI